MADLTSTIRITGTVGGKTLNFSHTWTVEDVVDAGAYHGGVRDNNDAGAASPFAGYSMNFRPTTIDYLFAQCTGTIPAYLQADYFNGATTQYLQLLPGQFVIAGSVGGGVFASNTTATTVATDPLEGAVIGNTILQPTGEVFAATLAVS